MTMVIPVDRVPADPALLHPRARRHRRREVTAARPSGPFRVALTFDVEHHDRPADRGRHRDAARACWRASSVPGDLLPPGTLGRGVPGDRRVRSRAAGHLVGQPLPLPCPDAAAHRRRPRRGPRPTRAGSIRETTGVDPRPGSAARSAPARRSAGPGGRRGRRATGMSGGTSASRTGSRRERRPPRSSARWSTGSLAHGDGAVVLLHAWPTATREAIGDDRRAGCATPGRRSCGSTRSARSRRTVSVSPARPPEVAVLAVDGGNSKTDVALVGRDGRLLAAVRGPTISHQEVGIDAGADRLVGAGGRRLGRGRARTGRPAAAGDGRCRTPSPGPTRRPTSAGSAPGLRGAPAGPRRRRSSTTRSLRSGPARSAAGASASSAAPGSTRPGSARTGGRPGSPRSARSRATGAAAATSGWRRSVPRSARVTAAARGPLLERTVPGHFGTAPAAST